MVHHRAPCFPAVPSDRYTGRSLAVPERLYECFLAVLHYSKICLSHCWIVISLLPSGGKACAVLDPGSTRLTEILPLIFFFQHFCHWRSSSPASTQKIFVADLALPVIIYERDVLTCLLCAYIELLQSLPCQEVYPGENRWIQARGLEETLGSWSKRPLLWHFGWAPAGLTGEVSLGEHGCLWRKAQKALGDSQWTI